VRWTVIALYLAASLVVGMIYTKRAGQSAEEYFLSDRKLPWWLAGTSMVATTFAADSPLAVTGLTVNTGIAGNWLWWPVVMSGMLTVFLYARLWRRSGVMTDAFQFVLAMAGSIAFAVFAPRAVGGLAGLEQGLEAKFPGGGVTAIMPDLDSAWMPAMTFFVYVAVNWSASW